MIGSTTGYFHLLLSGTLVFISLSVVNKSSLSTKNLVKVAKLYQTVPLDNFHLVVCQK
jgi:hypothetical protein